MVEWERPQLIALTRGDRQENVLMVCKTAEEWPQTGPQDGFSSCFRTGYCYAPGCEALALS
jgi:hypothetical protein